MCTKLYSSGFPVALAYQNMFWNATTRTPQDILMCRQVVRQVMRVFETPSGSKSGDVQACFEGPLMCAGSSSRLRRSARDESTLHLGTDEACHRQT